VIREREERPSKMDQAWRENKLTLHK
jgi:hypothetical protein